MDVNISQSPNMALASIVNIKATPLKGMVDDPVKIVITGLKPIQKVTLVSQVQEGLAKRLAFAHYVSDNRGQIATESDEALGGTYKGKEAMGLFWSLQSTPDEEQKHCRLLKKDINTPYYVTVAVVDEFVTLSKWNEYKEYKVFCETVLERWYLSANTTQEIVRHGRLRGKLFYPKQAGRYPGIIDLFGGAGGLIEIRSALLASHGFVTMALPFFDYDDLPKDMTFDYDYFDEAVQFMVNHPRVEAEQGLTVAGVSKGGEIAAHMASYNPEVRICIYINGVPFYHYSLSKYKGVKLRTYKVPHDKLKHDKDLVIVDDALLQGLYEPDVDHVPVHQSKAHFLILQSGDDLATNVKLSEALVKRIKAAGNAASCKQLVYPGAGHLLEPPFTPLSRTVFFKLGNIYLDYGGDVYLHAKAQEHAWDQILKLLREQYNCKPIERTPATVTLKTSRL